METFILIVLAAAPPAVFMYFIYWMDRHEPESMRTILAAMFIGALSTIPALAVQLSFGSAPLFSMGGTTGGFIESFFLVAPSEELSKFLFIYLFIRKKLFYDEVNDGIVYFGAGALGFALLENIFYVLDYGFSTGVLRAFTSIPIHTFCGVIIGYHAGLARFTHQPRPNKLIFRGLLLAYLTHALYNTLVSADSFLALLFIPLVAAVYLIGFRLLHWGRRLSISGDHTANEESEFPRLPSFIARADRVTSVLSSPPAAGPASVFPQFHHPPVLNYRSDEVAMDSSGKRYLSPKKETWKAVISRTLFAAIGLLWLLAFFGSIGSPAGEVMNVLLGMILLTIIPFMIGLLLELSFRRRRLNKIYLD
jgi:protease PrsW